MALSKSTVVIKALPIKRRGQKAVLDPKNIFNLMVRPGLTFIGTKEAVGSLPKVGSVVKIKTRFGLKSLVIIDNKPKTLKPNSKVKMIYAATHEHLMDNSLMQQFKSFMETHQLTIPKLNEGMVVVQGYHYGFKNKKPYVNMTKEYNFRVSNLTNHFEWMAKGHTASVLTQRGKSLLVIANILYPKGSVAKSAAAGLMPVISFHNYGIRNHWIHNLYLKIMAKRKAEKK